MTEDQRPIIAVDFDGTIVEHCFPDIGPEVPGAIKALKELQERFRLILWTCRSYEEQENLQKHRYRLGDAIGFCYDRDISFWGVNESPGQKSWNTSPKAFAHLLIDDAALGCPLIHREGQRAFVDWTTVMIEINRRYPKE